MTWRRWVRHGIDLGACATGVIGRRERETGAGFVALTYHRVLPDRLCDGYPLPSLVVPESQFTEQAAWLARHAAVLTAGEALAATDRGPNGRVRVCLTFDDGYADNAEVAAPILEAHGLRASFFVTTSFVESGWTWFDRAALHWGLRPERCRDAARRVSGGIPQDAPRDRAAWMDRLKSLDPGRRAQVLESLDGEDALHEHRQAFRPMDREQVRALHVRGHEIGSHTVSHPILPQLSGQALAAEIGGARETLRSWTGAEVRGFCYPNGDCSDATVAAVRDAGHAYAFTTSPGAVSRSRDPFRLPRRTVTSGSTAGPTGSHSAPAFRAELCGLHDALRGRR